MSCWKDGNPNSKLLIVGMAPGRQELAADAPFVGKSGLLLWKTLAKSGIQRPDCYILNTIGEWPLGKDGNPTPEQYDKWWSDFDSGMRAFQGSVVLVLGGAALWRVTGRSGKNEGIEGWRGYLMDHSDLENLERRQVVETVYKTNTAKHKKGDPKIEKKWVTQTNPTPEGVAWIIPTLHPAAVMRTGFTTLPAFQVDVDRAARAVKGELNISSDDYSNQPTYPLGKDIAFDIETLPDLGTITDLSMAGSNGAWSSGWNEITRDYAALTLKDAETTKIIHNAAFDIPRLEAAGITINGPIYDTMLAAHQLQPDLYKGLNAVGSLYLDTRRWKHEAVANPTKYSALDSKKALEIKHETLKGLEATGQRQLFEQTIMPTMRHVLIPMTTLGIKIDMEFRGEWTAALREQEKESLTRWAKIAPGVNPSSPHQVKKFLYGEKLALPPEYGKYGTITTDEAALRKLKDAYPEHAEIFTTLLDLRDASKLLGTYAERAIGPDGCVHPSYLPGSKDDDSGFGKGMAGTGRITAKDPNIQNQPPQARFLYVPHDPSLILAELDYSQIEARIMAALSGDERLMEACENGLHEANMKLLGVDKTRAKNGFYGWCYGAGARTLSRTFKQHGFDVSIAECERMLNAFNVEYAKTAVLRAQIARMVLTERMLTNPFSRRRYFYGGDVPAGLDYIPQSTAADIMWSVLLPVKTALSDLGGNILTVVHDSILVEVKRDYVLTSIMDVRNAMEREFPQVAPGFRVPVKIKVGETWGDMREFN